MTVDDTDQVLLANQAFYDAHEARDLTAMDAVWEHSDRVICVHPGWPILRTWPVVHESWRRILEGPGRTSSSSPTHRSRCHHGSLVATA